MAEINSETALLLERVYQLKPEITYEIREGVVFVIKENNAKIQQFLRKLHYKIPAKSELELDQYGSFIFQQIDGQKNVREIGELLGKAIDEANNQLYDRLLLYLNHLEKNERYIYLVK